MFAGWRIRTRRTKSYGREQQGQLADGTLAGSLLAMNKAVHNILTFTDCKLTDIIKMTSENPARKLGIFSQTGSITPGKYADLIVFRSAT